jgi:hypothetical protein
MKGRMVAMIATPAPSRLAYVANSFGTRLTPWLSLVG